MTDYTVTVKPTKDSTGILTGTCDHYGCSHTETVILPKLSEADYEKISSSPATETDEGSETWTLKDETYGTVSVGFTLSALGHSHNLTEHPAKEATCSEDGNLLYYSCECGKFFSDAEGTLEIGENSWLLSKVGHSYTYQVTTAPTKLTAGTLTGTCRFDGCQTIDEVVLPKLTEKDYTYAVTKEAEEGISGSETWTLKEDSYGVIVITTVIPAKGHSLTAHAAHEAGCDEAGNTLYYSCECGKYFRDSICETEIVEGSWIVSAKTHHYVYTVTKAPTAAATGTLTGTCDNDCDSEVKLTLPKLTETDYTYQIVKAAEEGVAGFAKWTWKDDTCGEIIVETVIPALPHTHKLTEHKAVTATCDHSGSNLYYSCTCGKYFSDAAGTKEIKANSWVISATGHNRTYEVTKDPSLDATGSLTGTCGNGSCTEEAITVTLGNLSALALTTLDTRKTAVAAYADDVVKSLKAKLQTAGKSETTTKLSAVKTLIEEKVSTILTKYIKGDVTGDGVINGLDVLRLMKYVAKVENTKINEWNSKMNGDDEINGLDILRLKKFIAKVPCVKLE